VIATDKLQVSGPKMADGAPIARRVTTGRPSMPGYGIATGTDGLLPWAWAEERIASNHAYWLATVDAPGAPHLAAVWAVWFDDALWFSTGGRSRKARDLAATGRCTISGASTEESFVLTGDVARVTDAATIDGVQVAYTAKYASGFPDPDESPLYRFDVRTVIGVIERGEEFTRHSTRWTIAP
jgi:general stress protein 26